MDVQTLLRNGAAAMYHAKQHGRNRYTMYSGLPHEFGVQQAPAK